MSNVVNVDIIYSSHTKFLRKLYLQKQHQFGLRGKESQSRGQSPQDPSSWAQAVAAGTTPGQLSERLRIRDCMVLTLSFLRKGVSVPASPVCVRYIEGKGLVFFTYKSSIESNYSNNWDQGSSSLHRPGCEGSTFRIGASVLTR